jgi:hypothetical protein
MTTIKRSYYGQWADQHAATSLATAEADEHHDEQRAESIFQTLKWAITVLAIFGCMLAGWWKA